MKHRIPHLTAIIVTALITGGVVMLLMNIVERKIEGRIAPHATVTPLDETNIDPVDWKHNFPHQYDGYIKTVDIERTRHGGSEAFSHLDEDPSWKRIFDGYAFGVDYREERGHAYMLQDQKETERTRLFNQPGACLHCHAGGMKQVYEEQGDGDLHAGFAKVNQIPLKEAWSLVKHPITCTDCHDPKTMDLRVTRPGFLDAIKLVKEKEGIKDYDPNKMATRQEMRTFVCGQCHVEYYFKGAEKLLTYPWHKGLKVEDAEAYYDEVGHNDFIHKETGAGVLKAQHPEFELWSQGVHAKSGVSCADCHMPYTRVGASKVTDHHVRSPLLNVSRACLQCHHFSEQEMIDRVTSIQDKTKKLLDRGETALLALFDEVKLARERGATDADLKEVFALQRKAQFRLDYISAENSMGFHAPQEAARILAEAVDYARQGQAEAKGLKRERPVQAVPGVE